MTSSLLVDSLATYRLTRLITQDALTAPLRDAVPPTSRLGYLVRCQFCASVWAAALVSAVSASASDSDRPGPARFLVRVLAVAAPTALLAEWREHAAAPAPDPGVDLDWKLSDGDIHA